MKHRVRLPLLFVALICLSRPVIGQSTAQQQSASAEQSELEELKRLNVAILQELKALRSVIDSRTPPRPEPAKPVMLTTLRGTSIGEENAPLTIVEFSDMQCPYCRQFTNTVFEQLRTEWIASGKVRYIVRDLPLPIHPQARAAARATRCAGLDGKFWQMRTILMREDSPLDDAAINRASNELHLDPTRFTGCMSDPGSARDIDVDAADAARLGVQGTPTFLIGKSQKNSVEGLLMTGVQPYALFETKLKSLLDTIQ